MPVVLLLILVVLAPLGSVSAEEDTQSDWSFGPKADNPVPSFGDAFTWSSGISWLAIPGQIALASEPLETPVKHLIANGHDGAYGLYAVDFDGDGDIDVIGTTDRSNRVIIWFNSGSTPPTWIEHVVDNNFRGGTSVHPADIDGDGDLDLVGASQTPGNKVTWWRNEGGDPITWTRFTIEDRLPVACNLFVADIDGDGDFDVASTSWSGGYLAWWRNDGQTTEWTRLIIEDQFPTAHSAFAFDADGDGDNDIVGTSADSGEVVLFINVLGDGTSWEPQVIGTGMNGVRYATAADINDDGRIDLAATAANGQLRWWRNEGGEPLAWNEFVVDPMLLGGHYVIAADLNGDGAMDLLAAPWTLDSPYWFRQDPDNPEGWDRFQVDPSFISPLTVFPADVDGDGSLDIIGTSPALGEISWWEVSHFIPNGSLESSVLDLGENHGLNGIRWHASVPAGTSLSLAVRSGDEPGDLGPWTPEIATPAVMMCPWKRYFQYRVSMESTGGLASPLLTDVTPWWNLAVTDVGAAEQAAPSAD